MQLNNLPFTVFLLHLKGAQSGLIGLKSLVFNFVVCNPCQSSPSLKGLGHAILGNFV